MPKKETFHQGKWMIADCMNEEIEKSETTLKDERRVSGILDGISRLGKFAARWDDDVFDRINHRYSTVLLLLFTVIVGTKQYVGEPIVCWCPAFFTGAMEDYAKQVCWVSNTYYLPRDRAPLTKDQPREQVLIYYQWVPFILLTQALFFQITNLFWIATSGRNGVNINRLIMMVAATENLNPEVQEKTMTAVVHSMDQAIAFSKWKPTGCCDRFLSRIRHCCCRIGFGRAYGNYLTTLYIVCKIMYIGNAIGQIYFLNFLLGADKLGVHYSVFGLHVIRLLLAGKDVGENSTIFPRITMCDFSIRQFSNLQDYTIECAVPINLFSEKFFIFFWFWIAFILLANIYSLLTWLYSVFSISQVGYVKKYLNIVSKVNGNDLDRCHIACFTEEYLRHDGVFFLRMLAMNTNEVLVGQLIVHLWSHYKCHHGDSKEYHKFHHEEVDEEIGRVEEVDEEIGRVEKPRQKAIQ